MSRRGEITEVALTVLEREGRDGLTMRAIAEKMDIRAPSLYKHIADKRELEIALIAKGFADQADRFEHALADGGGAVEVAEAYRTWAFEHPHLYQLMHSEALPRDDLPEGAEERSIDVVLRAFDGDRIRARAAWAFAHGMVSLTFANRFPPDADLETTWRVGVSALAVNDFERNPS